MAMRNGDAGRRKPALADRQITVGGETYTLRFSVKAMAALQDHFGVASIGEVGARLSEIGTNLGVGDMAAVLWSGLRTYHPEMSVDDALTLLDDAGLDGLDGIIGEAFSAAAPDGDEDTEGGGGSEPGPPRRGRSTGRSRKARRSA